MGFGLFSPCLMRALWAHGLPLWGELGDVHHTYQVRHAGGWPGHTPYYVRACVLGAGASRARSSSLQCRCYCVGKVHCAGCWQGALCWLLWLRARCSTGGGPLGLWGGGGGATS